MDHCLHLEQPCWTRLWMIWKPDFQVYFCLVNLSMSVCLAIIHTLSNVDIESRAIGGWIYVECRQLDVGVETCAHLGRFFGVSQCIWKWHLASIASCFSYVCYFFAFVIAICYRPHDNRHIFRFWTRVNVGLSGQINRIIW